MRAVDAVLQILRRTGEPMHYKHIAEVAIAEKLWKSAAKEPAVVLAAALSVYVRDNPQGDLRRRGDGMYQARPASERQRTRNKAAGVLRYGSLLLGDCQIDHRQTDNMHAIGLGDIAQDWESPPLVHDFRLTVPCWKSPRPFPHECAGRNCEEMVTLARVQVNEFPSHWMSDIVGDADDDWFWAFDRCMCGPSEPLGTMLDELLQSGEIWDGIQAGSGAVFHLQALEFNPHVRDEALGAPFLRVVLWLLSRSENDIAVAETRAIHPALPPLWGPLWGPATNARTKPDALSVFARVLVEAEFTQHVHGRDRFGPAVRNFADIGSVADGVSFYRVVRESLSFLEHLDGNEACALPPTLEIRAMRGDEDEEEGDLEAHDARTPAPAATPLADSLSGDGVVDDPPTQSARTKDETPPARKV